MKRVIFFSLLVIIVLQAIGQDKYITKDGYIRFYSHTIIEDITAENNEVAGIIDVINSDVLINVRMTAFRFKKKLMEEHFNENYVESEKYPKAVFKGKIVNNQDVDYKREGIYKVIVKGEMTIRGVSNEVETDGTIEITSGGLVAKTEFILKPEDYGIKIPRIVRKNIAEEMEITVDMEFKPL